MVESISRQRNGEIRAESMSIEILLPPQINANYLLPFISQLSQPVDSGEVLLDFSRLQRVTPAGVTALVATVMRWRKERRNISFRGLRECPITGYLQRMNVLRACGFESPENFIRHSAKGRFVPVRLIDHRVNEMGHEVAACLAPGGDEYGHSMSSLYELAWYVITEVANNVRQHGGPGLGYVTAQVGRAEGLVRIALADNGMGILKSFRLVEYPGSDLMNDAQAIQKALEPRVSTKLGEPNEGVGLTLVSGLSRLTKGWLMIVSGTGVVTSARGGVIMSATLPDNGYYHGTIIAGSFPERGIRNFARLLHTAKIEAGLLRHGTIDATFEV